MSLRKKGGFSGGVIYFCVWLSQIKYRFEDGVSSFVFLFFCFLEGGGGFAFSLYNRGSAPRRPRNGSATSHLFTRLYIQNRNHHSDMNVHSPPALPPGTILPPDSHKDQYKKTPRAAVVTGSCRGGPDAAPLAQSEGQTTRGRRCFSWMPSPPEQASKRASQARRPGGLEFGEQECA